MKSIDQLDLELCVVELRYDPVYRLWDSVGWIWSSMVAFNPALKGGAIQPTQQSFENEFLQVTIDTTVMRVSGRGPQAVEEVVKNAAWLFELVCGKVKLESFTRAGFRDIRTKAFPTPAQAMKFSSFPGEEESAGLGTGSRRVGFVNSTRFEGDGAGLQVALKVEVREISFTLPWESRPFHHLERTKKEWILVADSDYYTIGTVERESFDVETWVRQASKAIQNHWGVL
jgi:hypothetical protein